jgi:hypothetical protein
MNIEHADGDAAASGPVQNTTLKRRRFTVQVKLCLVRSIQKGIEVGEVSGTEACREHNIHYK